jgi:transposase-like protein
VILEQQCDIGATLGVLSYFPGGATRRSNPRRSRVAKACRLWWIAAVLAFVDFHKDHRSKVHATNPLERLIGEIKPRTEVVGIFPN